MSHLIIYVTLCLAMVCGEPAPEPEASKLQYVMAPLAATARSSQYFTRNFNSYDNLARALPAASPRVYTSPTASTYLGSGPQIINSEQSLDQIPLAQFISPSSSSQLSVVPIQFAYLDQSPQGFGYNGPYLTAASNVVDQGGSLVAQEGTQLVEAPVVAESAPQGTNYFARARSGSVPEYVAVRFVSIPQGYGGTYITPSATVQNV